MKSKKNNQKGFGLIEIILVIGVGMATFLGIQQYLNISLQAALQDSHQAEALYWARASLEQARVARDENWTNISDLTFCDQYNFIADGASPEKWISQAGTRSQGRYTVWFTISQVGRDGNSDIIVSGCAVGSPDPNTVKVTSNVSWVESGVTKQINVSEYLVNLN